MSLTLGMAFFKVRAQAYFSLKFMFDVVEQHLPPIHCYANDPQLHISFSPKVHSAQTGAVASIKHCIQDIRQWMSLLWGRCQCFPKRQRAGHQQNFEKNSY